ncbi:MAG: ABC transporter permease [Candidatus Hodarchaeota archaeon]
MSLLDSKAIAIGIKGLKQKTRQWQYMFFSIGFPLMFVVMLYFFLPTEADVMGMTPYDYAFPGLVMYATGMGTVSSAIMFATDKKTGMLERLDAMPTGRKNIFLGFIMSETVFITIQILIMFGVGYGILRVEFENFLSLLTGFLMAFLFGISSVGIGIIIASFSKTPEAANGLSMLYVMPVFYASGTFFPFESPIVYFTPPYWFKQVYVQLTVMGHDLGESLYSSSLIGTTAEALIIPIWGALLICVAMTIAFMVLGIYVFQKKTSF